VYDALQELPRKVSVSEVVSWTLRAMLRDLKNGKEFSQEDFDKWIESTPAGRDYRERLTEHWGPSIRKIDDSVEKVKQIVKGKRSKK